MSGILAVIGSLIAASGTVPYLLETVQGKTKPRIVTWLTWALLAGLAAAAAFSDRQFIGGFFALVGAVASGSVVVFGVRYGDRSFSWLDSVCLAAVLIGLAVWQLFNNPALGVWAAIGIDFVGLLPTLRHAWAKPHEETMLAYLTVCIGGLLAVGGAAAQGAWSVTAVGYPLYAAVSLGGVALVVVARKRRLPSPVRERAAIK